MATKQGDVALLKDPVAQELLQSTIPARFAYNWMDGTPRVVPIVFHWNGKEVVMGTLPDAPKMRALTQNPRVALTIDNNTMPYKVLSIRGVVSVEIIDGMVTEYELACKRYLGEEAGTAWVNQVKVLSPRMARLVVKPTWVGILDFEKRFPSAIESAMARAQGAQ